MFSSYRKLLLFFGFTRAAASLFFGSRDSRGTLHILGNSFGVPGVNETYDYIVRVASTFQYSKWI